MSVTVIKHGNVLDLVRGCYLEGYNVVIENDRIIEVTDEPITVSEAIVIEARGKTVMPGLIDCHVHVMASEANATVNALQSNVLASIRALPILKGLLHRGFTTVRDAGGADWALQHAVASGLVPGPRLFPSGKAFSQTGGHGDVRARSDLIEPCSCSSRAGALSRVVDGVDAMRMAAREELFKGATQLKIMVCGGVTSRHDPIYHSQYSEDEIRALVGEAKAASTYVMAHAYTPESIVRAVRCGVRTIEHGNLVDDEAAKVMREWGAYAVPTLTTYDVLGTYGSKLGLPADALAKLHAVQFAGRESLEIFRNAGVPMGFGTDLLGEMGEFQGREFNIRSEVLGCLESLRSATTVAAEILNKSGELGVIAADALADIIVVDGDPLSDINVLSRFEKSSHAILQGGKLLVNCL